MSPPGTAHLAFGLGFFWGGGALIGHVIDAHVL